MNTSRQRRRWHIGALAVALVGATSLASGCAPAASDPTPADPSASSTTTAVQGDTLTIAMQTASPSVNPATVDVAFVNFTLLAYEPLIYRASDGSLQPALAESWTMSNENTQLDLTLRPGVTFADGTPVDAAAVKGSLEYMIAAKGPNSQYLAAVSDIATPSDLSLTITLSQPVPLLPDLLTQSYGIGQVISPAGVAKPDALTVQNPSAGAGAYVFDPGQTVAGDHYTYTANPTYYDPSKQHYRTVVLKVFENSQAALNAITTGQVDVVPGDATTAAQAKAAGLQIAQIPFVWSGLNLIDRGGEVSKPLGDLRVRQAINYALDRKTLATAVLGEYGVPTTTTVVEGADGWSREAADRYPYDVAKAKALLAEAGYPDGFELPVLSIHYGGIDTMAEAMSAQLAEVGITLTFTYVTDAQAYVTAASDHSFPAVAVGYGAQPIFIMGHGLFLPDATIFNGFGTQDAELSALFDKAAAADPTERAKLDQQIELWLVDQAWFAPVAFAPVLYYAKADLGGLAVSPDAPVATPLDWYETN